MNDTTELLLASGLVKAGDRIRVTSVFLADPVEEITVRELTDEGIKYAEGSRGGDYSFGTYPYYAIKDIELVK